MKFKKGDEVQILKGKDAGKTGKIERVLIKEDMVLIPGINQFKRHVKARTQNQTSEIITITKPMIAANVMFHCPKCKKLARIGFKMEKDKKARICKNCNKTI